MTARWKLIESGSVYCVSQYFKSACGKDKDVQGLGSPAAMNYKEISVVNKMMPSCPPGVLGREKKIIGTEVFLILCSTRLPPFHIALLCFLISLK